MRKLRLLVLHKDKKVRWHILPWGRNSLNQCRNWGDIVYSEVFYE